MTPATPILSKDEFILIRAIVENACGIYFDDSKEYLVQSRLIDFLKKYNLSNFKEMYVAINSKKELLDEVIDLLTTNETSWFRDQAVWNTIKEEILLPYLIDLDSNKKENLKIWSAACSTGQEPYSLGICLLELIEREKLDFSILNKIDILATDISPTVLAEASHGRYSRASLMRGVVEQTEKYFNQEKDYYTIEKQVKNLVTFKQLNLMEPFQWIVGNADLILCRNVAIYFSDEIKSELLEKIAKVLSPSGILLLGSSESIIWSKSTFERDHKYKAVCYKLKT